MASISTVCVFLADWLQDCLQRLTFELEEGEQQQFLLSVLKSVKAEDGNLPSQQQLPPPNQNARAGQRQLGLSLPSEEDGQDTGLAKVQTYNSIASEAIDDENFTSATDEVDHDVAASTPKFLNASCPSPSDCEYDGSGVGFLV